MGSWMRGLRQYDKTPTGSDKRNLLDKTKTLYNRQSIMRTVLAEQLNTFYIKHPITVELSVLKITGQVSIVFRLIIKGKGGRF
jgi:hypothetical protein